MPRDYVEDDWNVVPAGRWRATFAQIIRGKRGQRILKDLEVFLLAMPKRALLKDQIVSWNGGTCLIGEYCVAKRVARGIERDAAIVDLLYENYDDWTSMHRSAELGMAYGIPWTLAWELAWANDTTVEELVQGAEYSSPPEERWASCLRLIQRWIVEGQIGALQ